MMKTKRVDGTLMEKMLRNGLSALCEAETQINDLNVFPVADGDTGTNMRLTLENGLRAAKPSKELSSYLKGFSAGALLGARGNSGVILSQIFKGIYTHLSRCAAANVQDLKNAFVVGYKTAYSAVVRPVEGTILTVCREGIEHIKNQTGRSTTVEELLSMYIAEMKKSLSYTPEMLSVLKEAGVVDSGAAGYIAVVEGMLGFLYGDVKDSGQTDAGAAGQQSTQAQTAPAPVLTAPAPDLSMFTENSVFEDGYCMEFILQLMNAAEYDRHFRVQSYISALGAMGNSIVCVRDGMRVKVHIHTKHPADIITYSQKYGEFLTFKLENMQLQHNEHIRNTGRKPEKKPLAVIAVGDSARTGKLFAELGCGNVINGGTSMNVSVEEIAGTVAAANAHNVVILPNNKNVLLAAKQAEAMNPDTKVTVIPTKSVAEGYFAMGMDIGDCGDIQYRIKQMEQGYKGSVTVSVTAASKPYTLGELSCEPGDMIAVTDDGLAAVGEDSLTALIAGLSSLPGMDERENAVIFRGAAEPEVREEKLRRLLSETFPDLEVTFMDGGSELYNWIAGLM